jgi:amino acid permease
MYAYIWTVEFVLSVIKIMGCIGFIILGIVIDCGGTGDQGYLGTKYWRKQISPIHLYPFKTSR